MDDSRVEKHAQIDPARASMIPLSELKCKLVCTIVGSIMAIWVIKFPKRNTTYFYLQNATIGVCKYTAIPNREVQGFTGISL